METPKQLRNVATGRIFSYTEALAKRSDMVGVFDDGSEAVLVDKIMSRGLNVSVEETDSMKALLREKDSIILNLQKELNVVANENAKLFDKIAELEKKDEVIDFSMTSGLPTVGKDPAPAGTKLYSDRMKALIEKCGEMIRAEDENDFTGLGLPRIERLEELSGIAEVSAQERTQAFEQAKKLLS